MITSNDLKNKLNLLQDKFNDLSTFLTNITLKKVEESATQSYYGISEELANNIEELNKLFDLLKIKVAKLCNSTEKVNINIPVNESVDEPLTAVEFVWQPIAGVNKYKFMLAEEPTGEDIPFSTTILNILLNPSDTPLYTLDESITLTADTTYIWKICGVYTDGKTTEFSNTNKFTTVSE